MKKTIIDGYFKSDKFLILDEDLFTFTINRIFELRENPDSDYLLTDYRKLDCSVEYKNVIFLNRCNYEYFQKNISTHFLFLSNTLNSFRYIIEELDQLIKNHPDALLISHSYSHISEMKYIDRFTNYISEFFKKLEITIEDSYIFNIKLVFRELLTNAIRHGNANDRCKNVFLTYYYRKNDSTFGLIVRDEGKGFDFQKQLEDVDRNDLRVHHRGLFLIKTYASFIKCNNNSINVEFKL